MLFARIAEAADILLLAGDLTDYGAPEEATVLAKELAALRIPAAAVLGNHDYESGLQKDVQQILTAANIQVLDGEACEVHGIGFAGAKGFCGGFGKHVLAPWGEETVKEVLPILQAEFTPISDARGTAEYRRKLVRTLFEKFGVEQLPQNQKRARLVELDYFGQ